MERKWWTLLVVCVATFMLLLDITIVNVALPKIARDLNASFSDIQWVIDAYALTLASRAADRRVARRPARPAAGVRDRAGAVLVHLAAVRAVAERAVPDPRARPARGSAARSCSRPRWRCWRRSSTAASAGPRSAIWGATIAVAAAIGPLLGGVLTEDFGWPSIFYINVPIGIVCVALTLAKVQRVP